MADIRAQDSRERSSRNHLSRLNLMFGSFDAPRQDWLQFSLACHLDGANVVSFFHPRACGGGDDDNGVPTRYQPVSRHHLLGLLVLKP